MNEKTEKELKKYFENFEEQIETIEELERAILENNLYWLVDNVLFYNHYLSLYSRILNNMQNNLEYEFNEEITAENYNQAESFIGRINSLKNYDINSFELYLLGIYFAQEGRI